MSGRTLSSAAMDGLGTKSHLSTGDISEFVAALTGPADHRLLAELGAPAPVLVTAGQQVYADYGATVLAKLESLQKIKGAGVATFFFWVDTVRSGSDRRITTIVMPGGSGEQGFRLSAPSSRNVETRFVPISRDKIERTLESLRNHVLGDKMLPKGVPKPLRTLLGDRLEQLSAVVLNECPPTLGQLNMRITTFLLEAAQVEQPFALLSEVLNGGLLTDQVNAFLSSLDEARSTLNRVVAEVAAAGIDPLIKEVEPDYLPLFYSCDEDSARLRLRLSREGNTNIAVASCHCEKEYRFLLGFGSEMAIDELEATKRWSPDVCLPAFQNDLMSGVVAGHSSAIYGVILNKVLEDALGKVPVPMLLPAPSPEGEERSLLFRFLFDGVIE